MALVLRLALAWALVLAGAASASAQLIQPRLTADGKALILLEEIREPPEQRQPLVTVEFLPDLGSRYIRVAGKSILPPAAVELRCGAKTWTIGRSEIRQLPELTHAFFTVENDVAETALAVANCGLVVAGVQIPIPPDLLRTVWAERGPPEPTRPPAPR